MNFVSRGSRWDWFLILFSLWISNVICNCNLEMVVCTRNTTKENLWNVVSLSFSLFVLFFRLQKFHTFLPSSIQITRKCLRHRIFKVVEKCNYCLTLQRDMHLFDPVIRTLDAQHHRSCIRLAEPLFFYRSVCLWHVCFFLILHFRHYGYTHSIILGNDTKH